MKPNQSNWEVMWLITPLLAVLPRQRAQLVALAINRAKLVAMLVREVGG